MNRRIEQLLVEMAEEVHQEPAQAIERIAEYARSAVNGEDSGILLTKAKGRVETPAGTSARVTEAHALQGELDEGPCLDAVRTDEHTRLVTDTATDERWPRWAPRTMALGYRSVISARLETSQRRIGSLNVYDSRVGAFTPSDLDVLQLLALHASVAYANAQSNVSLQAALDSRTVIGQAQGILMQAFDLEPAVAFAYLRRRSQDENTRLIDVAHEVVRTRAGLGRGGGPTESP